MVSDNQIHECVCIHTECVWERWTLWIVSISWVKANSPFSFWELPLDTSATSSCIHWGFITGHHTLNCLQRKRTRMKSGNLCRDMLLIHSNFNKATRKPPVADTATHLETCVTSSRPTWFLMLPGRAFCIVLCNNSYLLIATITWQCIWVPISETWVGRGDLIVLSVSKGTRLWLERAEPLTNLKRNPTA